MIHICLDSGGDAAAPSSATREGRLSDSSAWWNLLEAQSSQLEAYRDAALDRWYRKVPYSSLSLFALLLCFFIILFVRARSNFLKDRDERKR